MIYDLIIKNGKVIDGSGLPGFHGDVAVSGGRIVAIGKVSGAARQTLNADGLVVAPGIIDNTPITTPRLSGIRYAPIPAITASPGRHGQLFSGAGSGAPRKIAPCLRKFCRTSKRFRWKRSRPASIGPGKPSLSTWTRWRKCGINVAALIGHSAVRRYVMGEASAGAPRHR